MRNLFTCRLCLSGLLIAFAMTATAETGSVNAGSTITMDEAVTRSLKSNPALVASGYQIEAHKGEILQAGLKPNPELRISLQNVLGTGLYSGFRSAETTLSIGWLLERGKREGRVEVAQSSLSVFEIAAEAERLDIATETARVFLDILANQERLIEVKNAVQFSEDTVEALRTRVQAGRISTSELARAEAELFRKRLELEDLKHDLVTAHYQLAAQWGDTQPDFVNASGNALALPASVSFENLVSLLDRNPDIERYTFEQQLNDAELRLAEARAKPSWTVSAGFRRFEFSNDQAFVADMTIPLTTRNRNQGSIAKAQANMMRTDAERETISLRIRTQLFALSQEMNHSLHKAHILQEEIIPRSQLALAEIQKAYLLGRYGYSELRLVQAELLDAQMALIEVSVDAHRNVIEIERLIGTTLTAPGTNP
jgi:cobalt-zinc-cadmium efflux system outer membrane protein